MQYNFYLLVEKALYFFSQKLFLALHFEFL
jgi:hypothetical protein